MTLTTQQEQVLALISAGSTIADAAQSAGIHRNTVHNWLRSAPEFQQALDQARQSKALYWQEQAEQLASEALATIRALMTDPKAPPSTRLRAAQIILNLATNPPASMSKSVHKYALASAVARRERLASAVARRERLTSAVARCEQQSGVAGASACDGLPDTPPQAPDSAGPEPEKVHKPAQSVPEPKQQPYRRPAPKIGRNELCPCGSGKKFKRCCLEKTGLDLSTALSAA